MLNAGRDTKTYTESRQGFTIVELLIVVVVIAILAAITIVSYNGITKNARNSAIQSTLSQGIQKLELYKLNEGAGSYPATLSSAGLDSLATTGDTVYTYGVSLDSKSYCLALSQGGRTYYITSEIMNPKTGICNGAVGVAGTGDVAVDGTSSTPITSYNIFNSSAPGSGSPAPSVGTDGGGALKVGNRFYTTEPSGIKVTGLRIYNPASSSAPFLSAGITAYAYMLDWTGSTISGTTTFATSPVATKTFSGTRTAGTWTDISFSSPITLPAISNASGVADLITLAVQFAGGTYYVYAPSDPSIYTQSTTRPKTYLSETPYVGRGVNTESSGAVDAHYGIDIIYTPVTP